MPACLAETAAVEAGDAGTTIVAINPLAARLPPHVNAKRHRPVSVKQQIAVARAIAAATTVADAAITAVTTAADAIAVADAIAAVIPAAAATAER
jgi:hypothetical protein